MATKAKRPRKVKGYKMAAPIPAGFIVKNSQKQAWKIGNSIGKGGFGEIYCCSPADGDTSVSAKSKNIYSHVMKIEPHENGPLFVEMHFYMKVAKKEIIESWMKSKGIKRLGMPHYLGSGSFEYNSERFRFIVIDRYGQDLWSIFLQNKKIFPCSTALQVGLQIVDVLEFIHDQGYAHCDVKGTNLLLGTQKGTEDQVYLVDFGLASRYTTTEFKPDPKKMHNGTIEYISRDAHQGVITRRGDMEILGFNLLHWVSSTWPWENIEDPSVVEEMKKSLMNSVSSSAKKLIPSAPAVIIKYLEYVSKLGHDQDPDYNFCRKLFNDELKKLGVQNGGKIIFKSVKSPMKVTKKSTKVLKKQQVDCRGAGANEEAPSDSEDDVVEDEGLPRPAPKKTARSLKETTGSWKNCATAKASNVIKAGEYISNNSKPPKRQKKK